MTELTDLSFQLFMNILGATDKPNTAHTKAVTVKCVVSSLYHLRMAAQSKVVIGTKVQYRLAAALNGDLGSLG
jgi:hypothetical protein